MSQVHNISPVDSSGVVRCYAHGLEASLMTSISLNNPGRYLSLTSEPLDWADDPVFQKRRDRQASSEPSYYLLNTPSSSQIGPPTTPSRKRSLSNSLPSTQGSEATRRRKLIEDALKTPSIRPQDRTQKSALRSPQKRLEDIQLALSASKGPNAGTKTSHPLAHASPPTPTRIISSQPSVSSSRTLGSFPASSVSREESDDEDSELWVRVTPPRILEDVFLGAHVGTVSSEKGSQETIAGPSYSNRRDDDEV
ncbi:hypothetical protein C0989_006313 [Termitomyces sp. Mn162]|nr:hypothetical protein C0989_006313 [Termitomyces sp. Mn162]